MASLSWLGVGVNQSFWNVSFTSFCNKNMHFMLKIDVKAGKKKKSRGVKFRP